MFLQNLSDHGSPQIFIFCISQQYLCPFFPPPNPCSGVHFDKFDVSRLRSICPVTVKFSKLNVLIKEPRNCYVLILFVLFLTSLNLPRSIYGILSIQPFTLSSLEIIRSAIIFYTFNHPKRPQYINDNLCEK